MLADSFRHVRHSGLMNVNILPLAFGRNRGTRACGLSNSRIVDVDNLSGNRDGATGIATAHTSKSVAHTFSSHVHTEITRPRTLTYYTHYMRLAANYTV